MRRIRINKGKTNKINRLIPFTVENTQKTHTAKIIKVTELPNGEFVEVVIGTNSVLIGGLRELSYLLYNKRPDFTKPTFEEELYKGANEDLLTKITLSSGRVTPYIQGFNVSYAGAQGDGVIRYPKHKDGFDFDVMVPFRVIPKELNDFTTMKTKYLHHREVTIAGREYIEYFTKVMDLTVKAEFENGQTMPNNPSDNSTTDLDSRLIAEFPVNISETELVEHFRLRKEEGAEGTHFNSTMMMIGQAADITLDGIAYKTMSETHVYSKSNHVTIPHGVDAFVTVKYQLLHI